MGTPQDYIYISLSNPYVGPDRIVNYDGGLQNSVDHPSDIENRIALENKGFEKTTTSYNCYDTLSSCATYSGSKDLKKSDCS